MADTDLPPQSETTPWVPSTAPTAPSTGGSTDLPAQSETTPWVPAGEDTRPTYGERLGSWLSSHAPSGYVPSAVRFVQAHPDLSSTAVYGAEEVLPWYYKYPAMAVTGAAQGALEAHDPSELLSKAGWGGVSAVGGEFAGRGAGHVAEKGLQKAAQTAAGTHGGLSSAMAIWAAENWDKILHNPWLLAAWPAAHAAASAAMSPTGRKVLSYAPQGLGAVGAAYGAQHPDVAPSGLGRAYDWLAPSQ